MRHQLLGHLFRERGFESASHVDGHQFLVLALTEAGTDACYSSLSALTRSQNELSLEVFPDGDKQLKRPTDSPVNLHYQPRTTRVAVRAFL
jgi:hypothetical protein